MKTLRMGLITLLCLPAFALADNTGLGVHAGTLGLGAELNQGFNDYLGMRVQYNNYTYDYDTTKSDIKYNMGLKLGSWGVLFDLHPFAGNFRLSAGLYSNDNKIDATAVAQGTYDIGDHTYSGSQVGTLSGHIGFKKSVPYVGLGWGTNPTVKGFGFSLDAGAFLQGSPKVTLSATGAAANNSTFQSDLAKEQATVQDDINGFDTYPVIAIGFSYRF